MNAADALNAATYALAEIAKIANGEEVGLQTHDDPTEALDVVRDKAEDALRELAEAGYDTEHNL